MAAPAGAIASADGTFLTLSPGITEAGQVNGAGPDVPDAYTLQLNTNFFTSTACAGSPNPGCRGWEQFVFSNDPLYHAAYMQYWLINYRARSFLSSPCPVGWNIDGLSCWKNSAAALVFPVPVSSLNTVTLTGTASPGSDAIIMVAGSSAYTSAGIDAVKLASSWTLAEFNVFGDANSGRANFGPGTTMTVRTTVHDGSKNAPACRSGSFTAETNNLTIVGTPAIGIQSSPAIEFMQTNVPGTVASCVVAAGIGDTHLNTFGGLLYDFQAAGDFVLAQTGDFLVENRQVSGAPRWPNATVNKAVATRMGRNRVAVCTEPSRLEVNGAAVHVADGETMSLPGGVKVSHNDTAFVVMDKGGNSVRADDKGSYIDVSVGLGRWPANVEGLLADAPGQFGGIRARTGTVLTAPFAFTALYHEYADSWRVPPGAPSLLSDCGARDKKGVPKQPYYANNLDPGLYKRARTVCVAAGVKVGPLLDACTLDVAVIGSEAAAKVFVHFRSPRAEGRVVTSAAPP